MLRSSPRSTLFPYTTLFRSFDGLTSIQESSSIIALIPSIVKTADDSAVNESVNFSITFLCKDESADIFDLRSEEHTSELQSRLHLVCRLLLEKKKNNKYSIL